MEFCARKVEGIVDGLWPNLVNCFVEIDIPC